MLEQEIDGKTHVLVPKEEWEKIWDVLDRISELGDQMSFDCRFEPPTFPDWDDDYLEACEDCTFECDVHGYCVNEV